MTSEDAQTEQALQVAASIDLAQNTALPTSSPNESTPRKNKRRANADPQGAYTPPKRASLSKPAQSSTARRKNRVALAQSYAAKLDDSEDEDYQAAGKSARTYKQQPPRRGTRYSSRIDAEADEADSHADGDPFISEPDSSSTRICARNCARWDEEEMLTCAGQACREGGKRFHIQCVGFRNMPPMLRHGGEGVKWYCFDCRMENGVGWKLNGIAIEGEAVVMGN